LERHSATQSRYAPLPYQWGDWCGDCNTSSTEASGYYYDYNYDSRRVLTPENDGSMRRLSTPASYYDDVFAYDDDPENWQDYKCFEMW